MAFLGASKFVSSEVWTPLKSVVRLNHNCPKTLQRPMSIPHHCMRDRTLGLVKPIVLSQVSSRYAGHGTGFGGNKYFDSKLVQPAETYTGVEKSFEEWKYVEKLLPPEYIPEAPTNPSVQYPSGWKPANLSPNLQYLVHRTKNFMIPVYLRVSFRGERRNTRIKLIEGNIWALEQDVGKFLKRKYPEKVISTYVHEVSQYINIRGDYVEDLKEWLCQQGF